MLYLITSYMFVASLHFMLDVVGACAGMSQIMQLKRQCVALEYLSVEKCVEAMERAERWEGPGWTDFQKDSQQNPRTRPKNFFVRTKWLMQWGNSAKKTQGPPKKKKKEAEQKGVIKKSEEDSNVRAQYPCSFPYPHPTPFSLFPFLECTKKSVAQLVVFLRDGTHF